MTRPRANPSLGERLLRRVMSAEKAAALIGDLDEELMEAKARGSTRHSVIGWRTLQVISFWWAAWRINRERAKVGRLQADVARPARFRMLAGTLRDVRYGARGLVRRPMMNATAVLTLGLAAGAATAVYGVLDAVVLRAVPGSNASRLMTVWYVLPPPNLTGSALDHDGVDDAAARTSIFERVGAWKRTGGVKWATGGETTELLGFEVSPSFFPLFAVPPELGRWFLPEEADPGRSHVVILADSFWRSAFSGDRSIVGRMLNLNGDQYEIVGVMPASFDFPRRDVQLWVPDTATPDEHASEQQTHFAIALLRPDETLTGAREALAASLTRLGDKHGLALRFAVAPLRDQLVGPAGRVLVLLFGAVGLVLAVACGNVSILLLVGHSARARETAVRLSLGASRGQLVRLALVESVLIGAAGASLGVGLAVVAVRAIHALGPATIPRLLLTQINYAVLGFAIAVSLAASLLAGLLPALRSLRLNLETSLGDGLFVASGGGSLASRHRGQAVLALAQLVLVTILVVGSCLLLRSLVKLLTVDLGFSPNGLMAVEASAPKTKSDTKSSVSVVTVSSSAPPQIGQAMAASQVVLDHLLADVRAIPGVASAAVMTFVPTGQGGAFEFGLGVERAPGQWTALPDQIRDQQVSDDLFQTLGVRLVAGRSFSVEDTWGAPFVVVVNEAFARLAWPGESAVGKYINENMGRDGHSSGVPYLEQVVGVVATIRYELATGAEPQIYYPRRQRNHQDIALLVRRAPGAANLDQVVMDRLQSDGFTPSGHLSLMVDAVRESVVEPRFYALVLTLFALVAVVLAGVGVYGVTAHLVSQRTRELGVRLALGARREQIGGLIFRAAGTLALLGVVAGLAGAASLTGFLRSLLFEVTPLDGLSFVAAPVVVAVTAFVAGLGPARRAGKIDPATLLRG